MGALEDAQFASQLGNMYQAAAEQIGNYLMQNIDQLSKTEKDDVTDNLVKINGYSATFFSKSSDIAFANSDLYFQPVKDASNTINDAIQHIDSVNKMINIAAGLVKLALAIASADGSGISSAVSSISVP